MNKKGTDLMLIAKIALWVILIAIVALLIKRFVVDAGTAVATPGLLP